MSRIADQVATRTVVEPRVLPPLVEGQRLDRATFHARYEAMPTGVRAELIGGVVSMPSPVGRSHGRSDALIQGWLGIYEEVTPGVEVLSNATTLLDDLGEPQPDVQLRILPEYGGQSRNDGNYVGGGPELVVEIARSTRFIDFGPKYQDYERTGVREYLVIAHEPEEAAWFVLRDGRFVPLDPGPDGHFRSEVFPGLWLDANALFAGDRRGIRETLERGLATPEHAAFVARLEATHQGRG